MGDHNGLYYWAKMSITALFIIFVMSYAFAAGYASPQEFVRHEAFHFIAFIKQFFNI